MAWWWFWSYMRDLASFHTKSRFNIGQKLYHGIRWPKLTPCPLPLSLERFTKFELFGMYSICCQSFTIVYSFDGFFSLHIIHLRLIKWRNIMQKFVIFLLIFQWLRNFCSVTNVIDIWKPDFMYNWSEKSDRSHAPFIKLMAWTAPNKNLVFPDHKILWLNLCQSIHDNAFA